MSWNELWVLLQPELANWQRTIIRQTEDIASSSGTTVAASYPFGAYVCFGRENDATREDVVFSIDCKLQGEGVAFSCDLARADGHMIANGPTLRIGSSEPPTGPDVRQWLDSVFAFLQSQTPVVVRELR